MEEVKEYTIIEAYCDRYPHLISISYRYGLIHIATFLIKSTESLGLFPKSPAIQCRMVCIYNMSCILSLWL